MKKCNEKRYKFNIRLSFMHINYVYSSKSMNIQRNFAVNEKNKLVILVS